MTVWNIWSVQTTWLNLGSGGRILSSPTLYLTPRPQNQYYFVWDKTSNINFATLLWPNGSIDSKKLRDDCKECYKIPKKVNLSIVLLWIFWVIICKLKAHHSLPYQIWGMRVKFLPGRYQIWGIRVEFLPVSYQKRHQRVIFCPVLVHWKGQML